ncbi:MAG: ABC transporter permease [Candidatus Zixiibacteriota bacterium]
MIGEKPAGSTATGSANLAGLRKATSRPWLATWSLLRREFVRFIRQRHRVFGALGQPVIFLLLLGGGLGGSFRNPMIAGRQGYFEYFFPGTLLLVLLFTAIFSTISVIEDRKEGFLQSVLISPTPAWAIVLGKTLGGTALALVQAVVILLAAPLVGIEFHPLAWLGAVGVMFVIALGMTALGHLIAWRMDSVQGYHAIMNVALLPMWLLSGAFFPAAGAAVWMRVVMFINPLTYGLSALRHLLYLREPAMSAGLPSLLVSVLVAVGATAATLAGAVFVTRAPVRGV